MNALELHVSYVAVKACFLAPSISNESLLH